jgi:WD40 repeat protein
LCDLPEIVTSVAVARAQSILAAAGGDRTVRIFSLPEGKLVRIVRHHADWVQAIALSDDGNHAASASRDRTVKVFQTRTGELETTYTGHDTPLVDVAFSSNDDQILSIARDRKLHRWNRQSGEREGDLLLFPSEVQRLVVVDGDRVISGATDALVRITQPSDRQTLFALRGHRDVVQAIALSPDGETIATGSADGEVCIWETSCGTWLHRFVASPIAAAGPVPGEAAIAPAAAP